MDRKGEKQQNSFDIEILYNIINVFSVTLLEKKNGSLGLYMKSSDAKASKCHLKFSSLMMIFIKLLYLSSVISLKWQ